MTPTLRRVATSGWLLGLVWVVSRAVMLRQWSQKYTFITGDPGYYYWALKWVTTMQQRLPEYPVPVVWFLDLFRWASADNASYYVTAFAVGMAFIDAAFTLVLWRRRARTSAWYWTLFTFLMGPLLWFRFDVLPAVVVGGALLVLARHPRVSGALLGLGAAIKLWPALILLPLVHRDEPGRRRAAWFFIVGGLLALVSWAAAGTDRLFSPLTWQSDRGLQIESVLGSVLVAAFAFSPGERWQIKMSEFNAFEIYGPGVSGALTASTVLTVLAALLAAALGVRAWHRRELHPFTATMSAVAIIAAFIVANKTLSPQYMFWLGAPLAVLICQARGRLERGRAMVLAALGLLVATLTQLVYPDNYSAIIYTVPPDHVMAIVLLARNVLTVLVALTAATWAFAGSDSPESRPRDLRSDAEAD